MYNGTVCTHVDIDHTHTLTVALADVNAPACLITAKAFVVPPKWQAQLRLEKPNQSRLELMMASLTPYLWETTIM